MEIACIYYIIHSARAHGANSMKIVFPRDVLTIRVRKEIPTRVTRKNFFPNSFHNSLPLFLHTRLFIRQPLDFYSRFKHKVEPLNAVYVIDLCTAMNRVIVRYLPIHRM